MKSASQMLYQIVGCPGVEGATSVAGRCWLCGAETEVGVPWAAWQGAQFTDQNKCRAPESDHVCPACVWACSWTPPPGHPPAEAGKRGVNLRLFSHLFDARGYRYANKGEKRAVRDWLRGEHEGEWFAAIADSGQKHLVPWTPVNPPGLPPGSGLVWFEERSVQLGSWRLVDAMTALLTAGATKDEVQSGEWSARTWRHMAWEVRSFETRHGGARGGAWFALALWLSQRDEERWREIDAERRETAEGARQGTRGCA